MSTPVGTWLETFRLGEEVFESIVHFTANGKAFILSGPAPGGGGAGTWSRTEGDGFAYRIAERLVDEGGAFLGWVDIDHQATVDGDTFTSGGVSSVYDANDEMTASVHVHASGKRL